MSKIQLIDYNNTEQARILESCLKDWFSNPKELNLTSPKMRYPFKFLRWKKKFYTDSDSLTFVISRNNWIIGHISLRLDHEQLRAHIFHLIIAPDQRARGLAQDLINYCENIARELDFSQLTLFVNPGNLTARSLYEKRGYYIVGEKPDNSVKMRKNLID